jgi:predicted secreted protein
MPSPTTAASFKINTAIVADVASATVNVSRQQIDVTAIDSTYRQMVQGFLEGTISLEMFYDASHTALVAGLSAGTVITAAEVVWASGKSIKGDAFVSEFNISLAPNGVAMATCTLIFQNSAITVVAP